MTTALFVLAVLGALGAIPVLYGVYRWIARPSQDVPATSRQADEITRLLRIIAEKSTPQGATTPDTDALAAESDERTQALLNEAETLYRQDRHKEAIERVLTAYHMDLAPTAKIALHLLAGNAYLNMSDLSSAESHFRTALNVSKEVRDTQNEAAAISNLGLVQWLRGNLNEAAELLKQGLALYEAIGDKAGQGRQFGNLGTVLMERGDLLEAQGYHESALRIHQDCEPDNMSRDIGNLGVIFGKLGDLPKAEKYLTKALDLSRGAGQRRVETDALLNLGIVYRLMNRLEDAERTLPKGVVTLPRFPGQFASWTIMPHPRRL